MDMPMKLLGRLIKDARKKKKITQLELANALGISESYIKDLERGRSTPSLATLFELIKFLNFSVEPFFYSTPEDDTSHLELVRLLSQCDEDDCRVLIATALALLQKKRNATPATIAKEE